MWKNSDTTPNTMASMRAQGWRFSRPHPAMNPPTPLAIEKIPTAWTSGFTNEKATRQQGGLFSRENSSNGGLGRQNFLAKSYEPETGVSRNFLGNKSCVFNGLYTGC